MIYQTKDFLKGVTGFATGLSLFLSGGLYAAPGDLDTGFGTGGVVTTQVVAGASETVRAMAIQVDGKIVVAGYTFNTTNQEKRYALSRFNSDGSLDTGFGTGGSTIVSLSFDEPKDMTILPDGKILVLGSSWSVASGSSSEDIVLLRFNSDGSLDTTFDSDGSTVTDINMAITQANAGSADTPSRMALQSDGKILVSAQTRVTGDDIAILRYNSDGSLDTSFDSDGILRFNLNPVLTISDYARAIAVQPDGKIVIAGEWWASSGINGNKNPFVARFDSSGVLDPTFGIDGVSESLDIKVGDDVTDLLIQPDGKILVAGFARDSVSSTTGADYLLIRYNADGTLDTSFDNDGYVVTEGSNSSRDQGYSVVLQADGKILLGGLFESSDILLRYSPDGSLDTTFSADGKATSGILDWGWATVIQPDGNILNAGSANSYSQFGLVRYEGDGLDIQPDAFSFTDETGIDNNDVVTSDLITVSGLSTGVTVPVTISEGEYALNGATVYQSHIGYVQNGDQVNVRHTAAAVTGDSVNTTLSIGGQHAPDNTTLVLGNILSDIFTSTTGTSSGSGPSGGSSSSGSSGSFPVALLWIFLLFKFYRLRDLCGKRMCRQNQ